MGSRAPSGGHGCCKYCRAAIVWFKNDYGKSVPIDASSVKREDRLLEFPRHVKHSATCTGSPIR